MSSRGTSFGLTARTRKSLVFFWIALFVVSMALQYASAVAPQAALAAAGDPVIVQDPTPNGCNGVLPTPGSENTLKRLIGGDLLPGRDGGVRDLLPGHGRGCRRQLRDHRLRLHRRRGPAQVLRPLRAEQPGLRPVPDPQYPPGDTDRRRVLQLRQDDGVAVRLAGEQPQGRPGLLHRRRQHLGPQDEQAGDPLAGAHFHIVCKLPTTDAFLPATIIDGVSHNSTSGGQITAGRGHRRHRPDRHPGAGRDVVRHHGDPGAPWL